jgi:predicted secreted protein
MSDLGRNWVLAKNGVTLAGIRDKSFSLSVDNVDVTSDSSAGYRELHDEAGQISMDISFSGVMQGVVLRNLILAAGTSLQFTDFTLTDSTGGVFAGTWNLGGYEETGSYNGEITFSGSLQSSGTLSYTPA